MERTWRDEANRVLREFYAKGHTPTKDELFEAYPWGMREYWPYKVWCEQVKWWKAGCPQPIRHRKPVEVPEGQDLLL